MKASKAAGPLAMWVKSIVEYSEIFHSIEPLRKELVDLQRQESEMINENDRLNALVHKLEKGIEALKLEYSELIAKVENIKNDMKTVQEKVSRSVKLLTDLASESARW